MSKCVFLSALVIACSSVAAAGNDPTTTLCVNLPEALAETKAKLAASQVANIVVLGDSLTLRDGSYLPYFRQLMEGAYGGAGAGYQAFSVWTGGGFDLQWTWGFVNADTPPHFALDGMWASSSASPWPPTFTGGYLTALNNSIQIQYVAQPGGGSFTVEAVNVGVVGRVDTVSPTLEVRTFNYTYPGTFPRVWFQPQGNGQVVILGQNNLNGAASGVRIHRGANGGWGVGNFLQRNWTFDQQLSLLTPDLVMVWLGQNDAATYNRQTYAVAMNALVDRIQSAVPNAEIVLVGTYNSDIPQLVDIVGGVLDVAVARGLGFISMYLAAGEYEFFVQNDYLADDVHFSNRGGQYVGRVLFNAFESDGKTLSNPPTPLCAADTNYDNHVDTADLSAFLSIFGRTGVAPFTPGDFNGDGRVDSADLSILLSNFGCVGP